MKRSGPTSLILGNLLLVVILFCQSVTPVQAQWAHTYGGAGNDYAYAVQQTSEGGYIVAGASYSFGTSNDSWILKLDEKGMVTWQKTYGGTSTEYPNSILQTQDGGYIAAGYTASFGEGNWDAWVFKLDANGVVVWQKAYGGTGREFTSPVQKTTDGGYIVVGWTNSFGEGDYDLWCLKLDGNGNIVWQKTYGGTGSDNGYFIRQTADGGYIVSGDTSSFGAGNADAWILRLDGDGNVIWQKTYGGTGNEYAFVVQQTQDEGYIVAAQTSSFGAGSSDIWVFKLDTNGDVIWQKTYGGEGREYPWSIQQTTDSGYIVAGTTPSFGAGANDLLLLKLDANGNVTWQKTYGGAGDEYANVIQQTQDGGYIVVVDSASFGNGSMDAWVLKLDSTGSAGSCPLGKRSTVSVTDTTATVNDTDVTPSTSTATLTETTATVTDTTASPTQICPAVLNVLSPNGGEDLITASDWDISWTPFIRASSFKALYSLDNGTTWGLIGKGITGTSTTWHTPLLTRNKTKCLVKVVGLNKKGEKVGSDRSDGPFTIEVLTITDINEGEACDAGQPCPITWELAETITPDQLQISYTLDGGTTWKKEPAIPVPPGSTYDWTAPNVGRDRTCKVKLTFKAAGETVATATSTLFSINAP